ncbi:MAG: hypothetical protein Q8940_21645 [Bacteroidota bacterium]|nr:hypothetical protein [Bacteroidota bacterium]
MVTKEDFEKLYSKEEYPLIKIDSIRVADVGRTVSIIGETGKVETQYPFLKKAYYRCPACVYVEIVEQDLSYPIKSPASDNCVNETCGRKIKWELVEDESLFMDIQETTIYEPSKHAISPYEPHPDYRILKVYLTGEAVGKVIWFGDFFLQGKIIRIKTGKDSYGFGFLADKLLGLGEKKNEIQVSEPDPASGVSRRNKIKILKEIIHNRGQNDPRGYVLLEEVYSVTEKEYGIDRAHAEEMIKKLKQRGDALSSNQNNIKIIYP